MLHMLPDIERIALEEQDSVLSPRKRAQAARIRNSLRRQLREDVFGIIHNECQALKMHFEEGLNRLEWAQVEALKQHLGAVSDGVKQRGDANECHTTWATSSLWTVPKQATQPARPPHSEVLLAQQPQDAASTTTTREGSPTPGGDPGGGLDERQKKESPGFMDRANRMAQRGHGGNYLVEASGWAREKDEPKREASVISKDVGCCNVSRHNKLLWFVKSKPFEVTSCLVIAANAIFMGVKCQVQLQALRAGEPFNSLSYDIFDRSFSAFFILEWALRLLAYQKSFLRVAEWRWHIFDTFLVLATILDEIISAVSHAIGSIRTVVLRIFRILRLVRLLRIARYITVFRELRLMIYGILSSSRALVWSYFMIGLIIYVFSICFVQAVTVYLRRDDGDLQDDATQNLVANFGSLQITMRTLFFAVSGGGDWSMFVRMLDQVDNFSGLIFCAYILIVYHGVLHVVAGIFVESAIQTSKDDASEQFVLELARKDSYMNQMKLVLQEADLDKSGTINWDEFQAKLKDERLQEYFGAMELDPSEARGLFKLLDTDESDEVPIDEFVTGCFRLKGSAKGLDLASLMHENKKMMRIFMKFMSYTQEQFEELSRSLAQNARLAQLTQ